MERKRIAMPLALLLGAALAGCGSTASSDGADPLTSLSDLAFSASAASADVTAPSAPSNLVWTHDGMTVTLSWGASTDDVGVVDYQLFYGNFYLGAFSDPMLTLIGFKAATPYTFSVKARDAAGNLSVASNQVTVLLSAPPDTTPPSAPTSLKALSVADTSVRLGWSASSDDVGVVVYQVYSGATVVGTVPAGTSATVSSLTPGATYSFTVMAFDAAGNVSSSSNAVSVTTTASYSLTIAASGNGTTSPAAGTNSYAAGTTVNVTATPSSGYVFSGWSGAASGTSNPVSIVITGNTTLTASFSVAPSSKLMGVNWADQRDNFVDGVLYLSGLGASDTYSSAATAASQIVGQLYAITGANTVRLPINEPTVSGYWSTYTGAIDAALSQGNVILAYWAYTGGKPSDTSAFQSMWDRVVTKYGGNANAYFEVINEPYAYGATDLNNLYTDWLGRYGSVPRGRVILDGVGYAQDAASVGKDSRLNGTLLAVHDYSFFASYESETEWANHLASYVGGYASRTVATEWGGPMSPGSKNGVSYGTIDYAIPSGSLFADYIRGVSSELHTLGMGSVYWPGLRDGDWYSLTQKTGSGSAITLSLVNPSGLTRLQYAWGIGDGGGTYVRIRNLASGLSLDGMGSATDGADLDQSTTSSSSNQQWAIENSGNYVRIRNRATGLYLDGAGRTTDGSAAGQWSSTGSNNQQWSVITDGDNVTIRNRATSLYLDGMGRTTSGSAVAQYSSSTSTNQRWKISASE